MVKKKICYISNDLVVGGVSSVLINLCNRLHHFNYEIHLILLSTNSPMEKIIPLDKAIRKHIVKFDFSLDYSLVGYLKSAFNNKLTISRIENILLKIKEIDPDILHFHTLPRQLKIGEIAMKQNSNFKLVFTDHLVRFTKNEYKKHQYLLLVIAYRRLYRHFNIVSVSKAVQSHLNAFSITNNSKLHLLLENSIDLSLYSRDTPLVDIDKNCTIYVSRVNHHKGQNTLIKAWRKINHPAKGTLLIIGPDESGGKIEESAEQDTSIKFLGSISNIRDYLNKATLAIFPSQKEGLPISLLEKMAFELPIIVSNIPELTSIIEHEKEGLHFELDNVDDLKNKIIYALENKSKMIHYGKNARKKVEEICAQNDPIDFHNRLYAELIN